MTWHGYNEANSDYQVVLYSDSDSILASITMNGNHISSIKDVDFGYQGTRCLFFSSKVDIVPNTIYRLAIKPTTTNNIGIYAISVSDAADFDSWPFKQRWYRTHRTDSGTWTDTTTSRPAIGLLVDAFSDGQATILVECDGRWL